MRRPHRHGDREASRRERIAQALYDFMRRSKPRGSVVTQRHLWPAWTCRGCGSTRGPDNAPGGRDDKRALYCDACARDLSAPGDEATP